MPPLSQDIEAGLAPAGIGNPVPQLSLAGSTPPPAPTPAPVVDRQAFLQQLQQLFQQTQQVISPITNLIGEAQRDELRRQMQTPTAEPMPGAGDAAYRARVRAEQANDTTSLIGLARTEIPYAKQVAETVGDVGRFLGEHQIVKLGAPGGGTTVTTPEGREATGEVLAGGLESLVPTEVWMAALELVPGVGTVPDLVRLARRGGPEWVTAARALAQSDDGVRVLKALGSESGMAKIPGKAGIGGTGKTAGEIQQAFRPSRTRMVPGARVFASDRNNFGRIVSVDPQRGTANVYFRSREGLEATVDLPMESLNVLTSGGKKIGTKVVPLKSDELAQAWELLPAENQKLIGVIANNSMSEAQRAATLAASRSAKATDISAIVHGPGTPSEKLARMWKARRGSDLPDQPALRQFFDDTDITSYDQQIIDAAANQLVTPHEATNAGSILKLIFEGARSNGKKTPITMGERSLIGRIFGPELEAVLPMTDQKMSLLQKALAPFQVWRSVKTGFDNSALGRQGRKMMFSDPVEWWRAVGPNIRSLQSEEGYAAVMDQVQNAEHFSLGQSLERPLGIMERGSGQADEFMSPLTKHIPFLAATERGYLGFLNALRQGAFDKDVNALIHAYGGVLEQVPIAEIQRAADNINNASMYGNLSALGDNTRVAGQMLFSARGLASGPQFFGDFVRAMGTNASPTMRKIIARRTAAYVGSSIASLMVANQVGYMLNEKGIPVAVGAELNPWSQSFGEVRAGPIKFNPWGNEVTLVRAVLQMASGKKTPEGATAPVKTSRNKIAARALEAKFAPAMSIFSDVVVNEGKDFQGRPIVDRPWQYAIEQASPIFWFDVQDSMREQGWWGLGSIAQALGADVQVYGPGERVKKDVATQDFTKKVLEPAGARIEGGAIWPTVLDSDFASKAWQDVFRKDVPELGDLSKFQNIGEMRKAYVDYWYAKNGNDPGSGEKITKARFSDVFDAYDSAKQWEKNVKLERENLYRAHPEIVTKARENDVSTPWAPK